MGRPLTGGPSPISTALACRCPRCGKGRLFRGLLTVRPTCDACGLDFSAQDAGDGPAVFVILILGFIIAGLALMLETAFEPPLWLHAIIWIPLIVVASLDLGANILAAASLSFIGLGAQPPTAEWGAMLSAGRDFMRDQWWIATFPGLAIVVTVLGFNLLGDGLRDALDPRGLE